ncbi:tyrosine-type recombinase/integrase [Hoeflea sp. TYP-13]|uniref:tyrosine-type recombinase/integrase n=1 Tax=Hoeflea sp. TYP-13 TaxID=3230023 RepID=UPI0034C67B08
MAGRRNKLTAIAVEKRKSPGRMGDGGGLYLNIKNNGPKSWVYRWTPKGGKPREMGLGGYPDVSLQAARDEAQTCRQETAAGLDPKAERDRRRNLVNDEKSIGEACDLFLESMAGRWTNDKSEKQWRRTFEVTCAPIRTRPMRQADTSDVLQVLTPIWLKTPETAVRTRGRIESVFDYARSKGWRDGENPARWKGHLENMLPKRRKSDIRHHPAMPYQEVPAFIARLQGLEALAARALELLILTAARTNETLGAQWGEFDFDGALWTVPAERMKLRIEHRVPLSPAALDILRPLHDARISAFVFPGQAEGKPLSNMAMEMVLRRMKLDRYTVHGFRSSFRDWCGDETTAPREVAEAALAHKVGSDVERTYRRGDALAKRRQLMDMWADYCTGRQSENVVKIRVRKN